MQHEQTQLKEKRSDQTLTANGITIVGFMLFLSGVVLFAIGMIDILVHINSVKTAALLVGGIAAYKVGHTMIKHCATLRKRPERRRHLLSDNT